VTDNSAPVRTEYRVEGLSEPLSHYTDGVSYDGLLWTAVVGLDADGNVVGENDVVEQCRQMFRNLAKVLEAAGSSPGDVLKVTVYLTDVNDRERINPVRQEFFGSTKPASVLLGVNELALPGLKVEIDVVAAVRRKRLDPRAVVDA
jgi:2-iminobutanoate/2-iminopropanoate deaminase